MLKVIIGSAFTFFLVGATALAANAPKKPMGNSGLASVYSYGRTASGERLIPANLTGAHRTLPFGTKVQVTNRRNGRSVVVRINDRGPFIRGRVIDVTPAAARALGFSGLAPVMLRVLSRNYRAQTSTELVSSATCVRTACTRLPRGVSAKGTTPKFWF
jgi:rare lipoprotein A